MTGPTRSPEPDLSPGHCYTRAFALLRRHGGPIIGLWLGIHFLTNVDETLLRPVEDALPVDTTKYLSLLWVLVNIWVEAFSYAWLFSKTARAKGVAPLRLSLWRTIPLLFNQLLKYFFVAIGLIALVVPGLMALVVFSTSEAHVVAERAGPLDALSESWRSLRSYKFKVLLLLVPIGAAYVGQFFLSGRIPVDAFVAGSAIEGSLAQKLVLSAVYASFDTAMSVISIAVCLVIFEEVTPSKAERSALKDVFA